MQSLEKKRGKNNLKVQTREGAGKNKLKRRNRNLTIRNHLKAIGNKKQAF